MLLVLKRTGPVENRSSETVLLSTQNICFNLQVRKHYQVYAKSEKGGWSIGDTEFLWCV